MSLDNTKLSRCSECGRLMPKKEGETLCSRCLEQQKMTTVHKEELTIHKIIIPPSNKDKSDLKLEAEETVEDNEIPVRICSMCGNHRTLPNRDLCLNCMLDMYKGFQEASKEISASQKASPPEETKWMDIYTSTRRMEPFRRVRTQGLTWIKGYNLH